MTRILHLTLQRKFFAAIAAGHKRTEYREAEAVLAHAIGGAPLRVHQNFGTDIRLMPLRCW
jgi:hypothetical protein